MTKNTFSTHPLSVDSGQRRKYIGFILHSSASGNFRNSNGRQTGDRTVNFWIIHDSPFDCK